MLRTPFINMLVSGVHNEPGLIYVSDCTEYVAKDFKKGTEHIAKLFFPHMKKLDPDKTRCFI